MITLQPRFLIKNLFSYGIQVRQNSDPRPLASVAAGQRKAIRYLSSRDRMQLRIALDAGGGELKWSAPFNISDIGKIHLRLQRETRTGTKQYLMRVQTHIEGSSIFIFVSRETEPWPIKLRNDTAVPFKFKQAVSSDISCL